VTLGQSEQGTTGWTLCGADQELRGLDPVGRHTAWVSGDSGGVWRTTDGGATWEDGKILRTSDGGATWESSFVNDDPSAF